MSAAALPCLICGQVLDNVFDDGTDNLPYGGTVFATDGHYGSTFFDSFDGEEAVINLCDPCLEARTPWIGRRKRWLPVRCAGLTGFGRIELCEAVRPFTAAPDRDYHEVTVAQLGTDLDGIEWVPDIADRKAHLEAQCTDH